MVQHVVILNLLRWLECVSFKAVNLEFRSQFIIEATSLEAKLIVLEVYEHICNRSCVYMRVFKMQCHISEVDNNDVVVLGVYNKPKLFFFVHDI